MARFFRQRATYPCPVCSRNLRAEDIAEKTLDARCLESEMVIRKRILEIYVKTAEDFETKLDLDQYLEEREDLIDRLVNGSSVVKAETWREVDKYQDENAEQILRARGLQPLRKSQKVRQIIDEEGTFSCRVNAEWDDRERLEFEHPFVAKYQDLLRDAPRAPNNARDSSPVVAPQPLLTDEQGPANVQRQMSAGGQPSDLWRQKASYFFFGDLRLAAGNTTLAA